MSEKKWLETAEGKIISKKVQETKKEIEQLKIELEKLINSGINQSNVASNQNAQTFKGSTASRSLIANINESRSRFCIRMITNSPKKRKNICNEAKIKKQSPKKIRHYNPEEAREYIKKQREKRLEQKLQSKENQNLIDRRKQKLRELHQKTLQLVHKNVQLKRERSKSRDKCNIEPQTNKKKILENPNQLVPDLIPLHINSQQINLISGHPNITLRNTHENIPVLNIPNEALKQKAAVIIQKVYRGYRQRKLYLLAIRMKHKLEEEARKLAEEAIQREIAEKKKKSPKKPTCPVWLQLHPPESHPYNFINTVKRKLNLAASITPKLTSDVAVQISMQETTPKHDQSGPLSKKEIKQLLINSIQQTKSNNLKSYLSHNLLDVKLNDPPESNNKLDSDSDTSKNIPDISSESISKSKKKLKAASETESDSDVDYKLEINSKRLKKIRLEHGFRNNDSVGHLNENVEVSKLKAPNEVDCCISPRNSIIASNKGIKINKSELLDKTQLNITNKEAVPENLQSFLEYMENFNKTPKTPKIKSNPNENENKSKKSSDEELISEELPSKSKRSNNVSTDTNTSNKYSSNFTDTKTNTSTAVPSLKRPSISLQSSQMYKTNENEKNKHETNKTANFTLKEDGKILTITNSNQIHLKFETELHLLNDFNKSLRQFITVEKSLLELQNKNLNNTNKDTQTSLDEKKQSSTDKKVSTTKSIIDEEVGEDLVVIKPEKKMKNINYTRGCDDLIDDDLSLVSLNSSFIEQSQPTINMTALELSQFNDTVEASLRNNEISLQGGNMYAGLSLGMFDQLIKDEDARLENLKTILKIREKALLDRSKGELAWLEIQKKHLKETGQLNEVSLVKKKQRGIIIKLQHEKHEMQRLKQMQKAASEERKTILKEQRNFIKAQLATNSMMTKIKRSGPKERRHSGPFKVYNVHTHRETLSETSFSKRNSVTEEIVSYASRSHSVVSTIAEDIPIASQPTKQETDVPVRTQSSHNSEHAKRSLLMREAALQKRKKAAEELLQWHQRLLEEEKKIADLEMAANSVINNHFSKKTASTNLNQEKYKLKGEQLNLLWRNMTAREEKKFKDNETYSVSQVALERFCKDAKKYSKTKPLSDERKSESDSTKSDATKTLTSYNYTSEFETVAVDNPPTILSKNKDLATSSLSEIIQNISNISNEISVIHELSTITSISENTKRTKEFPINKDNSATKSLELILSQFETDQNGIIASNQSQTACSDGSSQISVSDSVKTNLSSESRHNKNKKTNSVTSKRSSTLKETNAKRSKQSTDTSASQLSRGIRVPINSKIQDVASNKSSFPSEIEPNSAIESDKFEMLEEDSKSQTNSIVDRVSDVELKVSKTEDSYDQFKISEDNFSENKEHESSIQLESTTSILTGDGFINENEENSKRSNVKTLSLKEDSNLYEENFSKRQNEEHSRQLSILSNSSEELEDSKTNDKTSISKESFKSKTEVNSTTDDVQSLHLQSKPFEELNEEYSLKTKSEGDSELSVVKTFSNQVPEIASILNEENSLTNKTQNDSKTSSLNLHSKQSAKEETVISEIQSSLLEIKLSNSESYKEEKNSTSNLKTVSRHSLKNKSQNCPKIETLSKEDSAKNKTHYSSATDKKSISKKFSTEESSPNISEVQILSKKLSETDSFSKKSQKVSKVRAEKSLSKNFAENETQSHLKTSNTQTFSLEQAKETPNKIQKDSKICDANSYPKHSLKENDESVSLELSNNFSQSKNLELDIKTASNLSLNGISIERIGDDLKTSDALSASNLEMQSDPSKLSENAGSFEDSNKSSKKAVVSKNSAILEENEEQSKLDSIELSTNKSQLHKDTTSNISEIHSELATLQEQINEHTSTEDVSEIQISSNKSSDSHNALELASKESRARESNELNKSVEEVHKSNFSESSKFTEKPDTQLSLSLGIAQVSSEEVSHPKLHVDVKKRISEILADTQTSSRSDKSPRLQDLYCTTYDLNTPELSPETGSPIEPLNKEILSAKFGDEAEELLKKQLAIEQEIKQLEQQQKEHIPYLYVREIPNKPPPPYTPPSTQQMQIPPSILPSSIEQVECMAETFSEVLYNAHENNQLFDLKFPEALINNISDKNITKACYELIFDVCKEIAQDHFKQFEIEPGPAWFKLNKKASLLFQTQPNRNCLEKILKEKLKEILAFKKIECKQNIFKWNHKKRDHVDELLILESKAEESEWTNYDYDELLVKNDITNDIMNILLNETAHMMSKILSKKTC